MERWQGKVALVTGASSGIGAAIVKKLVEHGMEVIGLARRVDRIEELAKNLNNRPGKLYPVKADLTIERDIINAIDWTIKNVGPIHILVNNAGIIAQHDLLNSPTIEWHAILDTNLLALCISTREVVNNMKINNIDGHIIHINSVAGHKPGLGVGLYGATKYAVTNVTEILRLELNKLQSKIKITSISPGIVDTEILLKSLVPCDGLPKLLAEDVADAVIYVIGTPPHVQVHEMIIKPVGEPF